MGFMSLATFWMLWNHLHFHIICRKSKRKMNGSSRSMDSVSWTTTRRGSETFASSHPVFSEDEATIRRWECWNVALDLKTSSLTVASKEFHYDSLIYWNVRLVGRFLDVWKKPKVWCHYCLILRFTTRGLCHTIDSAVTWSDMIVVWIIMDDKCSCVFVCVNFHFVMCVHLCTLHPFLFVHYLLFTNLSFHLLTILLWLLEIFIACGQKYSFFISLTSCLEGICGRDIVRANLK